MGGFINQLQMPLNLMQIRTFHGFETDT